MIFINDSFSYSKISTSNFLSKEYLILLIFQCQTYFFLKNSILLSIKTHFVITIKSYIFLSLINLFLKTIYFISFFQIMIRFIIFIVYFLIIHKNNGFLIKIQTHFKLRPIIIFIKIWINLALKRKPIIFTISRVLTIQIGK